MSKDRFLEMIKTSPEDTKRALMEDTENVLDQLFFGPTPAFSALMDNCVKPYFEEREDQLRLLLATFASKEHNRLVEIEQLRAKFMDSLLTPQAGEMTH